MKKKIIVGVTGASGTIYARRFIEILLTLPTEIHLIVSEMGWKVLKHETKVPYADFSKLIEDLIKKYGGCCRGGGNNYAGITRFLQSPSIH